MRTLLVAGVITALGITKSQAQLPSRAFVVGGGSIALQSGVERDPNRVAAQFGAERYPTRYFLGVSNETAKPVWVDAMVQLPRSQASEWTQQRIQPGQSHTFLHRSTGVVEDSPIRVQVRVYADQRRAQRIGSQETFMQFRKADVKAFYDVFGLRSGLPRISGWPEMTHPERTIPGTAADSILTRNIQLRLWKEESKTHRDCRHEVLKVEPMPLDNAAAHAMIRAADSAYVVALQARTPPPAMRMERWTVKSCAAVSAYEVLQVAGAAGTTDFFARRVREASH